MKREELAEYSQRVWGRQARAGALAIVFLILWVPGLVFLRNRLDWAENATRSIVILSAYAAVPVILFLALGVSRFRTMPKCPHCGVRFYPPLLASAITTGKCGHCGESIES